MARSLAVLSRVAHVQRKYQEATEYLRESLNLFRELGERLGIIRSLCGLAQVAWARESPGRAARLSSALLEGLRASLGTPLPMADRLEFDRCMGDVRARLGEQEFTAAFAEGQAKTLKHAIEYALSAA